MAGQPGESGEINSVIPDPDNLNKLYIGRGYDFGNVSVSTDAGATFTILQGHNNVEKTGIDEWSFARITIDFVDKLLINKHHFAPPMRMNLDGSHSTQINFPGVNPEDGLPIGGVTNDVPVRGLKKRAGGVLGRYTADGGFIYSICCVNGAQPLYYAEGGAPDVSSAVLINGVTIDYANGSNLLAHPTEPCTWVVQTGGITFSVTRDCGATWLPLPMNGFTGISRVVAMAYFPDASDGILTFTEDGRRFRFSRTGALPVSIDIKPGSFPNSINPRSEGVIPVAILTTNTFDAMTVDPLSVKFGPEGAPVLHGRGHREDVNGDGRKDLVLHFRTQDMGIACGDTSASLTGRTFSGQPIAGSDHIRTVGCNHEHKHKHKRDYTHERESEDE